MKIAVASGKGGTGKTLVATHLAWLLDTEGHRAVYVDADVEAPNGHLFLRSVWEHTSRFSVPLPALKHDACSGCGDCQRFCAFNAILTMADKVLVFPELCHGCGGCLQVCGERALRMVQREVGTIRRGRVGRLLSLAGELDVGEVRAAPLIQALMKQIPDHEVCVVDSPPGTSCSAVAAVETADRVILVTEPTPFGLHDLRLAVGLCREVGVPAAAVINRCDLGNDEVDRFLAQQDVPVLTRIPFSRTIATAYAKGELALDRSEALRRSIGQIRDAVLSATKGSLAA